MRSYLKLLDEAHWSRVHTLIVVALGVGWMLDSFEVNIVANVLGIVKKLFDLSALESSALVSIWLVGVLAGAWLFGYLADRLGRKRLIVLTILFYAVCTVLTGLAWSYTSLMLFRFLTALGVGAEYSVVNASVVEFVPARDRGWAGALVINFWSLGAILGSLITLIFISILPPAIGWRFGFAIGALGALVIALLRRYLPESPRWLLAHQRWAEARAVVQRLTGRDPGAPTHDSHESDPPIHFWHYRRSLAFGALLAISLGAGYYGLFTAIPLIIIPKLGLAPVAIPIFLLIGNGGGLVGGLTMTFLLDRWGRTWTVGLFFAAAALSTLLLMIGVDGGSAAATQWAFVVNSFFMTGAWTAAYPVTAELFPTARRATGMGVSVALGRVAAATGPILLVWLASRGNPAAAIWVLAGYWAIGALAVIWWARAGVEAKAQPLEDVSIQLAEA